MRIAVYGLWHLGCVTAACLAEAGHQVIGVDPDAERIAGLCQGKAPVHEPGLDQLLREGIARRQLSFTTDAWAGFANAEIVWVTFDTPVDDRDEADVEAVRAALLRVGNDLRPGTIVLISSQVPVGFTRSMHDALAHHELRFAYSPENLRLGTALDAFRKQDRVIVGTSDPADRPKLQQLLAPLCGTIEWMTIESAEMTKHALNAFLATSVTFINELSRLCEALGANSKEVERGLKSEARIGRKAYLSPGAAFAGGTLARDIRYLIQFALQTRTDVPLFQGVWDSNQRHKDWLRSQLRDVLSARPNPVIAILGLTYKPGTNTLRRSTSIETCQWLRDSGVEVRAHDPAVPTLPDGMESLAVVCADPHAALRGADAAIIATPWPEYRQLTVNDFVSAMRNPYVIDQNWFLADTIGYDRRVRYAATGHVPPLASRSTGGSHVRSGNGKSSTASGSVPREILSNKE